MQITAQMDTLKFGMLLLGLLLIGVLIYLINQGRTQQSVNKRLEARESAEDALKRFKADAERVILDAQTKRENATVGVVSQLASQIETLMTVHQQTMTLLEHKEQASDLQAAGITERNKIQADQTVAIKENTAAVKAIAPAVADSLKPVAEQFRADVMQDAQAWINGLKAEARGPMATIEGIPARLEQHEKRLEGMIERVPGAVVTALAADLRQISDHLLRLSDRIERTIVPPRELAAESVPMNERTAQAIADLRAETGRA